MIIIKKNTDGSEMRIDTNFDWGYKTDQDFALAMLNDKWLLQAQVKAQTTEISGLKGLVKEQMAEINRLRGLLVKPGMVVPKHTG